MTQQQLIEIVQQHHPGMGETEARLALNRAQDDFCAKTELIKKTSTLTSVAGQRYYAIASNILRIMKVQFNDVYIPRLVGNPLIDDDEQASGEVLGAALATPSSSSNNRYWYVDSDRIGIVEKGSTTRDDKQSDYQSCSVSNKEIRLFCIAQASEFTTALTDISELPTQYHDALAYKTISDGYLRSETVTFNPQVSQIFDAKYQQLIKDAKKEARSNYLAGASIIKPTEF